MVGTRFIPTLSLQKSDKGMSLGDSKRHKPVPQVSFSILILCDFIENEMVGVTGIEPVTPTMST